MATDDRPAYWTDREHDEPVITWVTRMQILYRIHKSRASLNFEPAGAPSRREVAGNA